MYVEYNTNKERAKQNGFGYFQRHLREIETIQKFVCLICRDSENTIIIYYENHMHMYKYTYTRTHIVYKQKYNILNSISFLLNREVQSLKQKMRLYENLALISKYVYFFPFLHFVTVTAYFFTLLYEEFKIENREYKIFIIATNPEFKTERR